MRFLRFLPSSKIALVLIPFLLSGCGEQYLLFNTAGPVAKIERNLILTTFVLTAIVVIPVIALMFYIIRRFRDEPNNSAPYRPEWSQSHKLEFFVWGIPVLIICVLGILTVRDTFRLVRPTTSMNGAPLTIQVTSLDWKWLFQYPDQKIATVNYCEIPTNRPVRFILTSDAPMNSFWVPQLGGQEYTMPGMAMRLWLQADKPGNYFGSGANFSGREYAHMKFNVVAKPESDFQQWIKQTKSTAPALTMDGYKNLVQQSVVDKQTYSSFPPGVFEQNIKSEGGMYMKHELKEATD
ncbi:cytochrome c oxidase subunit II [Alicyclobacillus fastidiosus]|uniref:Quinol oxidase subunit 2 n=1 Tax=Alicyclobacillus fastidiosus TaxID=392011 RepID=A0ABV5AM37_9BACL|nr:cytochrome ubiquinol oxidase subunit II [Alicyclobacillus fastidiosus]WEH08458.1 cytochrome ubiquinol oxidase subunit II [Alicyclobacillus fastidiosus]